MVGFEAGLGIVKPEISRTATDIHGTTKQEITTINK